MRWVHAFVVELLPVQSTLLEHSVIHDIFHPSAQVAQTESGIVGQKPPDKIGGARGKPATMKEGSVGRVPETGTWSFLQVLKVIYATHACSRDRKKRDS